MAAIVREFISRSHGLLKLIPIYIYILNILCLIFCGINRRKLLRIVVLKFIQEWQFFFYYYRYFKTKSRAMLIQSLWSDIKWQLLLADFFQRFHGLLKSIPMYFLNILCFISMWYKTKNIFKNYGFKIYSRMALFLIVLLSML